METFIEVKGIEYPVKFGFGSNKILARQWKLKTVGQVVTEVAKRFDFSKYQEPTFEQWDYLGDLIRSGILYAKKNANVTSEEICDSLIQQPERFAEIIQLYGETLPKATGTPEPEKN